MTTIALARDVHILGDPDIWKTALPHLIELYFREMGVFTRCQPLTKVYENLKDSFLVEDGRKLHELILVRRIVAHAENKIQKPPEGSSPSVPIRKTCQSQLVVGQQIASLECLASGMKVGKLRPRSCVQVVFLSYYC